MSALITNKNNPKVITVIGNERKIKIGRNIAFNIPKANAAHRADQNPSA